MAKSKRIANLLKSAGCSVLNSLILGARQTRGACVFCGQVSTGRCSWPVEKFLSVRYNELQPGDRVKRALEFQTIEQRPAAVVVSNTRITIDGYIDGREIVLQTGSREKTIRVRGYSDVRRAVQQHCGKTVCDLHSRSVADGVEYCADHWTAWERVA